MKLKSHVTVVGNPNLMFRTRMEPLGVELGGEASLDVTTSAIHAQLAEIPIYFAIPFMAAHRRRVVAASIGPFGIHIHPAQATIRAFGVKVGGTLGTDGASGETQLEGHCKLEIDLTGDLPGRLLRAAVEGVFEE